VGALGRRVLVSSHRMKIDALLLATLAIASARAAELFWPERTAETVWWVYAIVGAAYALEASRRSILAMRVTRA